MKHSKESTYSEVQADIQALFAERTAAELKQLFRDLAMRVQYSDFDHISVQAYQVYLNLSLMDLWTEHDDEEKCARLKISQEQLNDLRTHPEYDEINFHLAEEFQRLKHPEMMKDAVGQARLQNRVARRLERTAMHAKDPRESNKASELLLDRMMPRQVKETEKTIVMIERHDLEMWKQVESDLHSQKVIEGEVVASSSGDSEAQSADDS
jgi:hypothetical protein